MPYGPCEPIPGGPAGALPERTQTCHLYQNAGAHSPVGVGVGGGGARVGCNLQPTTSVHPDSTTANDSKTRHSPRQRRTAPAGRTRRMTRRNPNVIGGGVLIRQSPPATRFCGAANNLIYWKRTSNIVPARIELRSSVSKHDKQVFIAANPQAIHGNLKLVF